MTEYEILGLMDTHKAMKLQQIEVPDTFSEFITNLTPIDDGTLHPPGRSQGSPPESP